MPVGVYKRTEKHRKAMSVGRKGMKFSWEKPIEQQIMSFCQSMARQMEQVASSGQEEVREGARNMATAYRTVEDKIKTIISIKEKYAKKTKTE